MVEVALELFIGQVDAELFKAVAFEILKAEDVENAYVEVLFGWVGLEVAVQSCHYPVEQTRVESFSKSISHVSCLGALVSLVHCLS